MTRWQAQERRVDIHTYYTYVYRQSNCVSRKTCTGASPLSLLSRLARPSEENQPQRKRWNSEY